MRKAGLFLLFIFATITGIAHDFHVSITKVDYNPKNQSLEITFKIFTDDLERALEEATGETLFLGTPRENESNREDIFSYIQKNFEVTVNGETVPLKWIGKESEDDATWCYIEGLEVQEIQTISVKNQILTEIFSDQANLVHITPNPGDEKKSLMLNRSNPSGKVDF